MAMMQQPPSGKSDDESKKLPPEIEEGLENLERVLRAKEKDGLAGQNREMEKIFPGTKPRRIPLLAPGFEGCSVRLDGLKIPTVPYLGRKKPQP
jgi:hypothetical protein